MRTLLSLLLIGVISVPSVSAQAMTDVHSGHPYGQAISYLQHNGMVQGYSDGTFRPENRINRAEMVKILVGNDADMSSASCFRDVGREWFAPYVCSAQGHGMVSGYPDGTFRPDQPVSFVEAAALVVREHEGEMPSYGGVWYMPYASMLQEWNAVPPTVEWMDAPITRGEMAYMIWKADMAHGAPDQNMSDIARGASGSAASYFVGNSYRITYSDIDDEYDYSSNGNTEISLSVSAAQNEVDAGSPVDFQILVQNPGSSRTVDISLQMDNGLDFVSATSGAQAYDEWVIWDNYSLPAGTTVLAVTALAANNAQTATRLAVHVEADGKQASDDIEVRSQEDESPVGDPVLHWNAIALAAVAADHTGTYGSPDQFGPGASSRALAIVHAAIFDAVNSIHRTHSPYIAFITVPQNERISMDTAVAAAAHDTLVALYPKQRSVFDSALSSHLLLVQHGSPKTYGMALGHAASQQILGRRLNDGSNNSTPHQPSTAPGRHRVDPLNPNQIYLGSKWGEVDTFVLNSSSQFRAPTPPAIDTPEYADAYNEIFSLGGDGVVTPTDRTNEQTLIGLYWAYDGVKKIGTPPRGFNQIVRIIAEQRGNTTVENARLFALINLAMADAGIAAWESKYYYDYWRPVVAIREADAGTGPSGLGDGNPLTSGDVDWTPMGSPMSNMTNPSFTPPFPAYPSGHAAFGAAALGAVENFYNTDAISFTFVSDELNGVTTDEQGNTRPYISRSFSRLSDAVEENAISRLYLGVHWRFDATAGVDMGYNIADYITANALRPLNQ